MKVRITLNGTDENPWHRYGLKCNPFPQIPKAEATEANRILQALDSEPIADVADLRRRLEGCTPEFIELCIAQFKPGERVRFVVEFPTPWDEEVKDA